MDVVYVRTKLQALIAGELLRIGVISSDFVLVRVKQHSANDVEGGDAAIAELAGKAAGTWTDVAAAGFFKSLALAFRACLVARRSGGVVYNPNLTMAAVALATKLVPGSRFRSFDDGFANIVSDKSPYFVEEPLPGNGLKRKLLRLFLPQGAAAELRQRSELHFTIFPHQPNVVEPARLRPVALSWDSYLTEDDRAKLTGPVRALLIGTKYDEWPAHLGIERLVAELGPDIDLYLPHPREKQVLHPGKAVYLDGTAESAISFLAKRAPLRVYHLDSSVALTLAHLDAVEFVSIVPAWTFADAPVAR